MKIFQFDTEISRTSTFRLNDTAQQDLNRPDTYVILFESNKSNDKQNY